MTIFFPLSAFLHSSVSFAAHFCTIAHCVFVLWPHGWGWGGVITSPHVHRQTPSHAFVIKARRKESSPWPFEPELKSLSCTFLPPTSFLRPLQVQIKSAVSTPHPPGKCTHMHTLQYYFVRKVFPVFHGSLTMWLISWVVFQKPLLHPAGRLLYTKTCCLPLFPLWWLKQL